VILGAGFGGLFTARALARKAVDVTLIDRNNFHTFAPLLYQVATCALDPSEIAYPVRAIFRKADNIRFFLGEMTGIDRIEKAVSVRAEAHTHVIPYDFLVLAAGSQSTYYGNDSFREHAFELKSLADAVDLRNHALRLFERAVWESDPVVRQALLTFVVVGGGPTGLETAGALYELYNHVLDREYPQQEMQARVVLVEMMPHLLGGYPPKLQERARQQAESLGVEVIPENPLKDVSPRQVTLGDGTLIATHTLVWSVGVQGAQAGNLLGVEMGPGNCLRVDENLRVKGAQDVYAVGDMTYLPDPVGKRYPQMIPVAQQQAWLAAKNILAEIGGRPLGKFVYNDRGVMATIGRSRAVAWLYKRVQLAGLLAWLVWLVFHLLTLIGFRNRLNVLVNWVWNYFTYDRSVRIILEKSKGES
jgi:NADH dehydrogenase